METVVALFGTSLTATSRSGSPSGSGESSTVFTTLKIAVFAPMPRASVSTATSGEDRRPAQGPRRRSEGHERTSRTCSPPTAVLTVCARAVRWSRRARTASADQPGQLGDRARARPRVARELGEDGGHVVGERVVKARRQQQREQRAIDAERHRVLSLGGNELLCARHARPGGRCAALPRARPASARRQSVVAAPRSRRRRAAAA